MGDTRVPFVTKPRRSLPVRRRRVRWLFWLYFLSIAVPAFSTLSPDLSISSDAFWVRLACSLWTLGGLLHPLTLGLFRGPGAIQSRTFSRGAVVLLQRLGLLLHLFALVLPWPQPRLRFSRRLSSRAQLSSPGRCPWLRWRCPLSGRHSRLRFAVAVMASRADNEAPRRKF